jgi:hypothetical protein
MDKSKASDMPIRKKMEAFLLLSDWEQDPDEPDSIWWWSGKLNKWYLYSTAYRIACGEQEN